NELTIAGLGEIVKSATGAWLGGGGGSSLLLPLPVPTGSAPAGLASARNATANSISDSAEAMVLRVRLVMGLVCILPPVVWSFRTGDHGRSAPQSRKSVLRRSLCQARDR